MPTTSTIPTFGGAATTTAAASTAASTAAVPQGYATNPLTGGSTSGGTTSGALTAGLAQARFKVTAPTTTTTAKGKGKSKGGPTILTVNSNKQVPVTTRAAVLRFIAAIGKGGPSHELETKGGLHLTPEAKTTAPLLTQAVGPRGITLGGKTNIGTPLVGEVNGQKVVLTDKVQAVINTIGRHVFKSKSFTISTDERTMTGKEWEQITTSAATRAHDREQGTALGAAQKAATPQTTGTVTGQKLYTLWLKTYDSGGTGATPNTAKKTNAQVWNERFVAMGLPISETPTPAQAQNAYKQVLKMAQDGNTSATKVIQTQIKANAPTLAKAETQTQGIQSGQALVDYYAEQFTNIAHSYLVPISQSAINQRAATAAAASAGTGTGTYRAKDAEEASFTETMKQQAASLYSSFATQINKGVTTQTLLDPYAQVAAKTLGYGTASGMTTAIQNLGITWMSPKWNAALSGGKSDTGKLAAPMSLTAFRQHLITTPQYGWQNTATASQIKLSVGQSLADSFGLRKP